MKSILNRTILLVLLGGMSCSVVAEKYYTDDQVRTLYSYAGIDLRGQHVLIRETASKSNIPRKILKRNYWGWDLFMGSRFLDHAAIEFGIFRFNRNTRNYTSLSGDTLTGTVEATGTQITTSNRFQGAHLDLFAFIPHRTVEDKMLEFMITAGAAYTKTTLKIMAGLRDLTVKPTKTLVPRFGVGLQWMPNDGVAIRALVRCEMSSRIAVKIKNTTLGREEEFKPFNNSIAFSLGVFMAL